MIVNSGTFHSDFKKEFQNMFEVSDYIHISSNDSRHDQNLGLTEKSKLVDFLSNYNWGGKTISLEIYEGFDALIETHSIVSSFI